MVLCTRDRAGLLAGALDSLERQDAERGRWEIVVVDNASSDGTAEVVASHPGVRCVREERIGLSHARNLGFRSARGRYVGYADDDCRLPPGWVTAALSVIDGPAPEVFGGPYRPFYLAAKPAWFRDEYGSSDRGERARFLDAGETLPGGNVFFRRDLLERLGGFDPRLGMAGGRIGYGEESDLQERLRALCPELRVFYDPDLCVEHLVRPEKMSLRWRLAASFGKGSSAYRARLAVAPVTGRTALAWRALRTALGAAADGTLGALTRDRRRYRRIQNYLYESTARRLRTLGTLWAALREPDPGPAAR